MGRTPCCNAEGLKKGAWTSDEDQKLIAYVQEHGEGGWRTMPQKAGLQRCGKSCRLRWANYLRPDIKRGEFSTEEEQKIIQLHVSLGNRWSAIARHLPKRTDNDIKNYWNTHLKKLLAEMGIDPVTHNPVGPSPSNHSSTRVPRGSHSDLITPSATSLGSPSSSTSAKLLNKLASNLASSLKTAQDLRLDKYKDGIVAVKSSSPVSSSLDYPNPRKVSTSAKLLNKMASRLNNTLKSILSRSTEQDSNDYNNNYDNNNDKYLQRCASASSPLDSTSDISRSISTSNDGGLVNSNNNIQDEDSNVTPLLDPLDLYLDLLNDWNGTSDGGVSSTSIGDTYNREPSMSPLHLDNDAPRISGCESSEFQDLLHTYSDGDVNDELLVTRTGETTATDNNEMAIISSHDVLEMGHSYKEHYYGDGFSNFDNGYYSNMANNSSSRESHFGGSENDGKLLQEANSHKNYWFDDLSNYENYDVHSDLF